MRSFTDSGGECWQAAVLDASYGNMRVVFTTSGHDEIRQAVLGADSLHLAEQQLAQMDAPQLRRLLAESIPWA